MKELSCAALPLTPLPGKTKDSTFQAALEAGRPLRPLPLYRTDGSLPPTSEPDGKLRGTETCSPYFLRVPDFVRHFGGTPKRLDLLDGLLGHRAALRRCGFTRGFQWIGGSFVRAGGNPRDIDVACFVHGSARWTPDLGASCPDVFGKERVKDLYQCDARFIDARSPSYLRWMIYWWHVYSSCKPVDGNDPETHYDRRLGFVELSLATDDDDAAGRAVLTEIRRRR